MRGPARTVPWRTSSVRSADGTTIQLLSTGAGPGLVVLPGNSRRARDYTALAGALAGQHTVHVPERRGRGDSGPPGPGYGIDTEVADALAVLDHTGSAELFGHSYGGLIALHVALRRDLARLIAYEPGVSLNGSFDGGWLPAYEKLLAAGRHGAAMAVFLRRTGLVPVGAAPPVVFRLLAHLMLHGRGGADTRALMATTPAEVGEVLRLDSDGRRYACIRSPTLLLAGDRSPAYLTRILPELAGIIPDCRSVVVPGLDHNAPDLNAPATVADLIRGFSVTP